MADAVGVTAQRQAALGLRLSGALPLVLLVFAAACFALPAGPDYALVFYLAVAPCTVAALAMRTRIDFDAALALAVALIAWSGCTLLWGHDDGHRSLAFFRDTLCTLLYVLALAIVIAEPAWRGWLVRTLIVAGAANALGSMALGLALHPQVERLTGWGVTKHPILGAAAISIPYLLALHGALAARGIGWRRACDALAALAMAVFILFTGSRGPLLAASIATLWLCAAGPWRRVALPCCALVVLLWWAPHVPLPHFEPSPPPSAPVAAAAPPVQPQPPPPPAPQAGWLQPHSLTDLERRGTSFRLAIWRGSLEAIRQRPLFGHGLADNLHVEAGGAVFTFPHDLYLSLLFYSGIVGLLLFGAMIAALTRRLARLRGRPEFPVLAALLLDALLAGLTDLGQITKGPGPIWIILWLPLMLAMTADARRAPA